MKRMTNHPGYALAALALTTVLYACDDRQPSASPPAQASETPYQLVADIHQTMTWILEPAADVIWDSAGTIITAEGERDLSPTSDDGWIAVLHAATTLTEAGNLLMMPGRSAGDDWLEYSAGLVEAGKLAMQAAQARDAEALFDAGGRIYQVCRACHNQYWIKSDGRD